MGCSSTLEEERWTRDREKIKGARSTAILAVEGSYVIPNFDCAGGAGLCELGYGASAPRGQCGSHKYGGTNCGSDRGASERSGDYAGRPADFHHNEGCWTGQHSNSYADAGQHDAGNLSRESQRQFALRSDAGNRDRERNYSCRGINRPRDHESAGYSPGIEPAGFAKLERNSADYAAE
jgi:hypothetical protein